MASARSSTKHRYSIQDRDRRNAREMKVTLADVIDQLASSTQRSLLLKVDDHEISFTNLDKVFWPKSRLGPAITKRDYAIYLARISPYLLPHLRDRPVTLVRLPNGIASGRFYQRHWDFKPPPFVETVKLYSEHKEDDGEYILCSNLASLLWFAQIANLELHAWLSSTNPEPDAPKTSRTFTGSAAKIDKSILNHPDFLVFDLDPYIYAGKEKEGDEPELNRKGFKKTCDLALWLKDILDGLKVDSFLKTTGKTGLHVFVPLVRRYNFDTTRSMAQTIGDFVREKHPRDVTMEWSVGKRPGKVFLDHNMNARSKTLAAIYSARGAPGAPISFPLGWNDLREVYPTDFTINTVPDLLAKQGDLWSDILEHRNQLKTSE